MNCNAVRKHLLAQEAIDRPDARVSRHLAACAACRGWHSRLVLMEQSMTRLPVPPGVKGAAARAALLRVCRQGARPVAQRDILTRGLLAGTLGVLAVGLRTSVRKRARVLIVLGLAALFWIGVFLGGGRPPTPKEIPVADEPLVVELERREIHLLAGATPRERVRALAEAAGELHDRSGERTLTSSEAADLARLYERVVRDGIVPAAEDLSAEERREILEPIAQRLAAAESEARRLSEQEGLPAHSVQALQQIARAAGHGSRCLLALCPEEKS
jgi:hypothetical protein